jgi:hypothetical protein
VLADRRPAGMSSNPTTETSLRTRNMRAKRAASSTPIAVASLAQCGIKLLHGFHDAPEGMGRALHSDNK